MPLKETGVVLVAKGATGFLRDMGKATNAVTGFGKEGNVVSRGLAGFGKGVLGVGKILGGVFVAGTGAAAAGLALTTKEAISLESAFAGVIKTTDGLTDSAGDLTAEGEAMKQEFRDLAKVTPTAIEELMGIGELGGQLGIAREDLVDFTATIAAMGEATNLTTEEAAVGFAQMANIMGTPSEEIENMGSSVVALGNNLATTERDIFNFANRIAGAGNIAGLTEAQVFGISGAFTSVGIEAAAGGTAVQKVLLGINEAVLNGSEDLETFASVAGISAEDFGKAWEDDAGAVFTSFVEGLGVAGDEATGILSDLGLEDQRLIKAFLSLAGAGDLLSDAIGLSSDAFVENTALMAEAEARYGTTESKFAILKNTIRDLGFTVGDSVLPPLNDLLDLATPLINDFTNFISIFTSEIDKGRQPIGAFSKAVFEAFPPEIAEKIFVVRDAFLEIRDRVNELISVFEGGGIGGLIESLFSPEIAEKVTVIVAGFLTFKEVLTAVGSAFISAFAPAIETLKAVFTETETFQNLWVALQPIISVILATLGALFLAFLSAVVGVFTGIANAIQPFVITVTMMANNIVEIFTGIGEWFSGFFDLIRGLFEGNSEAVEAAWQQMSDAATQITSNLVEGIVTFFVGMGVSIFEFLKGFVSGVLEFFTNLYNDLVGNSIVIDMTEDIIAAFADMIENVLDAIATFVTDMISDFTTMAVDIVSVLADFISNAVEGLKKAVTNFTTIGGEMMDGLKAGIMSRVDSIISAVTGAVQKAVDAAKDFLGIESPSKVFAKLVGQPISQGIAQGVLSDESMVSNAVMAVINPMNMNAVSPVGYASQQISNTNISSDRSLVFNANYASQPAVKDQHDLAFALGVSGVSA